MHSKRVHDRKSRVAKKKARPKRQKEKVNLRQIFHQELRLANQHRSCVQFSERLVSLGIMGAQLRGPETPRTTTALWY